MLLRRRVLDLTILPLQYQQVEYLQNNSDAYINSGFVDRAGYMVKVITSTHNRDASGYPTVIGAEGSPVDGSRNHGPVIDASRQWICGNGYDIGSGVSVSNNTIYKIEVSTKNGNSYINIDNVRKASASSSYTKFNGNLFMFCMNKGGAAGGNYKYYGRIYLLKLYNSSNVLVRDYYPCYRRSDLKGGLYDLLNAQFYTSANSTNFVYGENFVKELKWPYDT